MLIGKAHEKQSMDLKDIGKKDTNNSTKLLT